MSSSTNIVPMQGNAGIQRAANVLVPTTMDQAMRLAEIMAKGSLVPSHLHGNPGNCFLVIEQAMRWQMSPFAVAQCTFFYKNKLGFEGKLVAAAVEGSGAIDGLLDYQFIGDLKDLLTRGIVVSAIRRGEQAARSVEVMWKDAKTANEQWTKQPDQMLVYHGARVWARRWTPSVILGVYTREELADPDHFDGPTIDAHADGLSDTGHSEQDVKKPEKPEPKPLEYPMTTARWSKVFDNPVEWRDAWVKLIRNCVSADALDKLRSAASMNEGAFATISEFDRETSDAVLECIDYALTEGGSSRNVGAMVAEGVPFRNFGGAAASASSDPGHPPAEPSLEDRVDHAIQEFALCMGHPQRQKAERNARNLLFELDQAQREDLRNKLVGTMNFTMQRITKREAEPVTSDAPTAPVTLESALPPVASGIGK